MSIRGKKDNEVTKGVFLFASKMQCITLLGKNNVLLQPIQNTIYGEKA